MLVSQVTVLGFVLHPDGDKVLMVNRISRKDDEQLGKFNGLGGKVEPDEDVVFAMKRELEEEAGIEPVSMRLRGTVSWPGFGRNGENVLGFIYLIDKFNVLDTYGGEIPKENEEGPLSWQPIAKLGELEMWEGDRHFLPLVFDESIGQFHGCLPYENGRPVSWSYSVL